MTVLGLPQVLANLSRMGFQIEGAAVAGLHEAGEIIREAWVGNIVAEDLVLTGHYRDSVTVHDHGPALVSISSDDTDYARWLEFGTSRVAAHHVAERASDESHDKVVDAVGSKVRAVIR